MDDLNTDNMTLQEYIAEVHIMVSYADNKRLRNNLLDELEKAHKQLKHLLTCWKLDYEPEGSIRLRGDTETGVEE